MYRCNCGPLRSIKKSRAIARLCYNSCKPDSVIPYCYEIAAIYLGDTLLHHSICLPAGIGRAALNRLPIGHFSTKGLPIIAVTCNYRALLPHIFTLTFTAVIFCGAICIPPGGTPSVRWCVALCCPDFPLFLAEQRQHGFVVCKDT